MQVAKNKVVTLNYTLTNDQGEILDQSQDGSFVYLHGAFNIIPGLENALEGKQADDSLNVRVAPEEAYGERNDSMIQAVPRDMFESDQPIEVGMQFHAQSPDGQHLTVTVTEISDETVTVDGNHPLAGVTLNFDVTIISVRDASSEEIDHGHVHGPGGHHH